MIVAFGGLLIAVLAALVAAVAIGLLVNWLYALADERGFFPTRPSRPILLGGVLWLVLCAAVALAVQIGWPLSNSSSASQTTSASLTVRVENAHTDDAIGGAQVILEGSGAPTVVYTDNNGYALLQNVAVTDGTNLRVTAIGYKNHSQWLPMPLSDAPVVVRLEPSD